MVRELSLAPIHPDCNKRCRIRLNHAGDALLLGRESETPPGEEFDSGITSKFVHRKHVRIEGEPPVLTALGKQPCIVINSEGRLKLTEGETCVLSCVDTYTPEPVLYVRPPAYCSYPRHRAACRRARVPASGVPTAFRAVTPRFCASSTRYTSSTSGSRTIPPSPSSGRGTRATRARTASTAPHPSCSSRSHPTAEPTAG